MKGLKCAPRRWQRKGVFPSVPWQRCQFHLQTKRAKLSVPKQAMKAQVADEFAVSFDAKTPDEAKRHIELLCREV